MSLELIVCETCRHRDGTPTDGAAAGAVFAEALKGIVASDAALDGLRLTTMKCLMACGRACTVHLRAPNKMGYVIGDLSPDQDMQEALVDYLRAYLRSANGVVPYAQWPEALKGKFVARVPPLPSPE